MHAAIFVGDEVNAAGFRLAGMAIRVPEPGAEAAALAQAVAAAPLVLVSECVAARLPAPMLEAALRAPQPLTVVVPNLATGTRFADHSARLRHALGIEA